jgi:uncharacterized protein (UPF0332 family)
MGAAYDACLKNGGILPFPRGKVQALKELDVAEADFSTARGTFDAGNHKWAVIQIYSAMLHAARALINLKNLQEQNVPCLEALLKAKALSEEAQNENRWVPEIAWKMQEPAAVFLNRVRGIVGT